ncbi:hypothetical protein [Nocardia salmonicida]|uniref:hypothetical protein n=1 Tax=Nocardia salmonicida TaxID=53431 RepID=UPI00341D78E8
MTETRQQRRARERAEQKSATRPGPNHRPGPEPEQVGARSRAIVDIEVTWREVRRDPDDSHWEVHWTERESDTPGSGDGYQFEECLSQAVDEIRDEFAGSDLTLVWNLDAKATSELETQAITLPVS